MDPEKEQEAKVKQRDDEIRRETRRKQREAKGRPGSGRGPRAAMTRSFLEDEPGADYDDVGLDAIKASSRAGPVSRLHSLRNSRVEAVGVAFQIPLTYILCTVLPVVQQR